ncbi:MAG: GDSL-type esterase/lipase family protein [Ruthenibacterium sp.]
MKNPFPEMLRSLQKGFAHAQKEILIFWNEAKKGSVLHIAIFAAAGALAIALIVLCVCLLLPQKAKEVPVSADLPPAASAAEDSGYDKDAEKLDTKVYDGVVLQETEDAGAAYLNETLFVGDSNTARMVQYGPVTLQNTLGASSMGIQHVLSTPCMYFSGYNQPVLVTKAVSMMQPRRIIMNYGTNNTMWDADTFKQQYKAAAKGIHDAYPDAELIIAAVLPVAKIRQYPTITMQKIDSFNKALAELAKEDGYRFLNATEAVQDASGYAKAEYMMTDGIHMNDKGTAAYFDYVRKHASDAADKRGKLEKMPQHLATPDTFFGPPIPVSEKEETSSSSDAKENYSFTIGGATLAVGQSVQLNATSYQPSAEKFVAKYGSAATWASSNSGVVAIDGGGKVTAVSAGSATITCNIGGMTASATVTVTGGHTHKFTLRGVPVAPTCTTDGYTPYLCEANDGAVENRDIVPKLGHAWGATNPANGVQTCTRCAATQQDPTWKPVTPPASSTPTPTPPPTPPTPPASSTPTPTPPPTPPTPPASSTPAPPPTPPTPPAPPPPAPSPPTPPTPTPAPPVPPGDAGTLIP